MRPPGPAAASALGASGTSATVAVAYSGGRDSTALLHATLSAAREAGLRVLALHVHHGLSAHADAWADHCAAQCRLWAQQQGWPVHCEVERLRLRVRRGDSIEAIARAARYAALQRMALAHGAHLVLLAHHRRDQAETFLLQALRGAGVAGLSAMPSCIERDGVFWARPWLGQPREAIERYVAHHRLVHIDDHSNADPRFARNRLRLTVWPALAATFDQAEGSLAEAARHAQQARACADDLAGIDLATCVDAQQGLRLAAWQQLAPHRAINALRAWLRAKRSVPLTAAQTQRLMEELPFDGPARWCLGDGELRRYRGVLRWQAVSTGRHSIDDDTAAASSSSVRETHLSIRRAGRYRLPGWGGCLVATRVASEGLPLARLSALELVERRGGERFQPALGRPPRSLKKQYQSAAVPAWARQGPLIYAAGDLLFVPGLGIDARRWAEAGAAQIALHWAPDRAPD